MSRITKILTGIAVAVTAVAIVTVPAKADASSDALNAGLIELQKIAAQTANDKAAVEAAAAYGMAQAQANQALDAAAAAAAKTTPVELVKKIEAIDGVIRVRVIE